MVTDHLSRIPNAPIIQAPINENFPDEHILAIFKEPWYADIVNYLGDKSSNSTTQNLFKRWKQFPGGTHNVA